MKKEKRFPVIEVFGPTIQGEGVMAGKVTMFIRFGACDYECKHCDSMHAVDKAQIKLKAKYLTADEIVALVKQTDWSGKCPAVTLSGGNPALWDLTEVVSYLKAAGYYIAVETQGTIWKEWLAKCDLLTVSPKGPSMHKTDFGQLLDFTSSLNEAIYAGAKFDLCVKIPVFDDADLEFAERIIEDYFKGEQLYLSLGNSWEPIFDEQGNQDGFPIHRLRQNLCQRYDDLAYKIYQNDTLRNAIFLPQIHVLVYGNEGCR